MGFYAKLRETRTPATTVPHLTPVDSTGEDTTYGLAALHSEAETVANTPQGERNDALNRAWYRMGSLVGGGQLTGPTARQHLAQAALQSGLPQAEITEVLRTGSTGGLTAGQKTPRQPSGPDPLEDTYTVTVENLDHDTGEITENQINFWQTRPILQHVHDYARARMAAPWATLGAVLVRVVASTPWTVHLPPIVGGKGSLNTTVAIMAPSGGGKGAAEAVARDAVYWPHIPEYQIGSGEAIAHCLKYRVPPKDGGGTDWSEPGHNALISMSEVDKLAGQAARQGSTIMPELRKAWSGESLGHVTADQSRRIPIEEHTYRVSLILGVQPLRAQFLLDDSAGGFPQRTIWLPATDPHAPDSEPEPPAPITWKPPDTGPLARTGSTAITVCDQAAEDIRQARRAANKGDGDKLDSHKMFTREKVAAALGILDGRYSITDEDWQLAGVVMQVSDDTRARTQVDLADQRSKAEMVQASKQARTEAMSADAIHEADVKRASAAVLRRVRKAGEIGWSELRRSQASKDRQNFEAALERLEDAGQVVVEQRVAEYQTMPKKVVKHAE